MEVEEQMSAYVMNELEAWLHEKIEHHIETCESCHAWFCEVREMAEIWSDKNVPVDGLNLVDPVLRKIGVQPQCTQLQQDLHFVSQSNPNPQSKPKTRPQTQIQKKKRSLQSRMVYVHYGLAASFTIALFQLGVFEHLGLRIVNNGILFSQQVEGFLRIFGTL